MKILVINGPNINFIGRREKDVYGTNSLENVIAFNQDILASKGIETEWFQSNGEGEIVDRIQKMTQEQWSGLVINPGGYSHTSVAIHDALKLVSTPIIEVHMSHIDSREDFRKTLITTMAASGVISGLGERVYALACLAINMKGIENVSNDRL